MLLFVISGVSIALNVLLFSMLFTERPRIEIRSSPFRVISIESIAVRSLPHSRKVYEKLELEPSRN